SLEASIFSRKVSRSSNGRTPQKYVKTRACDKCVKGDIDETGSGVKFAVGALKFYKREISPLIPMSCRYVPTCSEYAMEAYSKYGVVKGSILTVSRLARCNPLGGRGYDPPVWFGEKKPTIEDVLGEDPPE
ncbi:hypothetical protein CYMTET_14797, partial [Cymbomonas tetramitiformis]